MEVESTQNPFNVLSNNKGASLITSVDKLVFFFFLLLVVCVYVCIRVCNSMRVRVRVLMCSSQSGQ